MILESKKVPYVAIDITDPSQEEAKEYMTSTAVPKPNAKVPVTPQIFNEADYCGDFDQLDMANECDTLGDFLKLSDEEKKSIKIGITGILPEDRKKAQEEQKNLVESAQLTNGVTAREDSGEKTTNGEAAPAEEPAAVAADAEDSSSAAPLEEPEAVTATQEQQSPPPAPVNSDTPAAQERNQQQPLQRNHQQQPLQQRVHLPLTTMVRQRLQWMLRARKKRDRSSTSDVLTIFRRTQKPTLNEYCLLGTSLSRRCAQETHPTPNSLAQLHR
ncbi:SH3-binding glutamic acid-rich protein [Trinorchestia longiramus]|nr:SH3-binding glutamic acid-rich protein [Trinorchestia longiramus]